jgi:hypothetical protein
MAEKAPAYGSYYSNPSLSTLAASDNHIVPNLIVGRHGFGEIQFERQVDLSGLSSLDDLLGKVVCFQRATCHVYPEGYQSPPAGEGLNVPAKVRIVGCWPRNMNDEKVVEDYIELLRIRPETEFVGYDLETGTWTFCVQHFSSYTAGGSDYYVPRIHRLANSSSTPSPSPSSSSSPSRSRLPSPPLTSQLDLSSHILRSNKVYTNPVSYSRSPRNPRLVSWVKEGYSYWKEQKPIPAPLLEKITSVKLSPSEFLNVFHNSEAPEVRVIELIDGTVRFQEFTLPVHGTIIMHVADQIAAQDQPQILKVSTGVSTVLCLFIR